MELINYHTITGFVLTLTKENEIEFFNGIFRLYKENCDWSKFGVNWMFFGRQNVWKGSSNKQVVNTDLFKICQDLETRLGIKQGKIPSPDWRDILADAIKIKYDSRAEFCRQCGVDQGHLSRVLNGKSDFSINVFSKILDHLEMVMVFVDKNDSSRVFTT